MLINYIHFKMEENKYFLATENVEDYNPIIFNNMEKNYLNLVFPLSKWRSMIESTEEFEDCYIHSIDNNFRIDLFTLNKVDDYSVSLGVFKFLQKYLTDIEINLYTITINRDLIILDNYDPENGFEYDGVKKVKVIFFSHCTDKSEFLSSSPDDPERGSRISIIDIIELLDKFYKPALIKPDYFKLFFHNCFYNGGICKQFFENQELITFIKRQKLQMIIYCSTFNMPLIVNYGYLNYNYVEGILMNQKQYGNLEKYIINHENIPIIKPSGRWKEGIKSLQQFYLTEFLVNN